MITDRKSFTVPSHSVQVRTERECSGRPYFSFTSCSEIKKVCMLHEVSGWDAQASYPLTPVTTGQPAVLEIEQLRMWAVVLRTTYPKALFRMFDPGETFQMRLFDGSDPDEHLAGGVRAAYQADHRLLFPLHCPECKDHKMGHFALLAIQGSGGVAGKAQVRYYETMFDLNEICLSKAHKVLSILGLPQQGFERCNKFRQKAAECTECAMHYAELEVRHAAGEGWGSVLALHPEHRIKMRQALGRFQKNLEPVRVKWVEKERAEVVKIACLEKIVEQKVGQEAKIDNQLDRLWRLSLHVAALHLMYDETLPKFALPKPTQPRPEVWAQKKRAKALSQGSAQASTQGSAPASAPAGEPPAGELPSGVAPSGEPPAGEPPAPPSDEAPPAEPLPEDSLFDELPSGVSCPGEVPSGDSSAGALPSGGSSAGGLPLVDPQAGELPSAQEMSPQEVLAAAEAEALQEISSSKPDEAILVQEDEPIDPVIEQKLVELASGKVKMSKWLEGLSTEQKTMIIETHFEKHQHIRSFKSYLQYVQVNAVIQGCSKCRYERCEKCSFSMAQNYVLRNHKIPAWWSKKKDHLLQSTRVPRPV